MIESRPQDCSNCSKAQHLHVSKVIDGKVLKMGMCSGCPHAANYTESHGFDLVKGGVNPKKLLESVASDVACPNCGLTPNDFKESGRLGCPTCYEAYAEKLQPLYRKLHKGAVHLGKTPKDRKRTISPEEIENLKKRMREHVIREEYELAAVVRDQLKSLEG